MKIENLIEKLQEIRSQYGNVDVITYNSTMECLSGIADDVKFSANEEQEREMFYDAAQMYDDFPVCIIVC